MSSVVSNINKRQSKKTDKSSAGRAMRERKTTINKARRMMKALKASRGSDGQTATELVNLCWLNPWLKNIKL